MNRKITGFLLIVIIVSGISSCTIKKRLYRPGYHIEWKREGKTIEGLSNRHNKNTTTIHENNNELSESPEVKIENNEVHASIANDNELVIIENKAEILIEPEVEIVIDNPVTTEHVTKSYTPVISENPTIVNRTETHTIIRSISKALPEKPKEIKHHWLSVTSLVFGILGFVIPFVPSLMAIILGVIAARKIKKYPNAFKGSGLATAGIIAGIAGLVLIIGYMVLVLAVMA